MILSMVVRHLYFFLSLLLTAFLLLIPVSTYAGVNLKNGNFYINYTDVVLEGRQHVFEIRRTYNSKSAFKGLFGFGWGTDIETYLVAQGDGSVIVYENGGGAKVTFLPPVLSNERLEKAVTQMVEAAVKNNLRVQGKLPNYEQLLQDSELRSAWWKRLVNKGFIKPRKIKPGTNFRTHTWGGQRLMRTHDGYLRYTNDLVEKFNLDGMLIENTFSDGESQYILRDHDGRISRVQFQDGRFLQFHLNTDGRVVQISPSSGNSATYSYVGNSLVLATDVAGNTYLYNYDDFYNLTSIGYSDGSFKRISYELMTQFTQAVTDSDDSTTWYKYGYINDDQSAYFTEVHIRDFDGQERNNRHEYYMAKTPNGRSFAQRIRTDIDGVITDTTYNSSKKPIKISRGQGGSQFEYDARNRLTLKVVDGQVLLLSYDDTVNKISKVVKYAVGEEDLKRVYEYEYLPNGYLLKAFNNQEEEAFFSYNKYGHLITIEMPENIMNIEYNQLGKRVMFRVGDKAMRVDYDQSGEVEDVSSVGDSNGDALDIQLLIYSLSDLVEPSGESLGL